MNLQNGYKVIYEKAADGNRAFYASKTGVFADAEKIAESAIGQYKLIYEKAGSIYGSESGIPADTDIHLADFDKVFKVAVEEPAAAYTRRSRKATPVVEEPVVEETPVIEE
jgi:hypothetical protein